MKERVQFLFEIFSIQANFVIMRKLVLLKPLLHKPAGR